MVAIAFSAAVGGLTTSLAVTYDALLLLTAHTAGAHAAFSALHNLHRYWSILSIVYFILDISVCESVPIRLLNVCCLLVCVFVCE